MKVLLIDPFQRKIHPLDISKEIKDWYKWCDCDCFDHAYIGVHSGRRHDIFVDDEGLLKEPHYPVFQWKDYSNPLVGYGLITACDSGGNAVDTPMIPEYAERCITWELWEGRLKAEDYFEQISRIYFNERGQ